MSIYLVYEVLSLLNRQITSGFSQRSTI